MSIGLILVCVVVIASTANAMLPQYDGMCKQQYGDDKPLACIGSSPNKLMCISEDQRCNGLFDCGDDTDDNDCDYGTNTAGQSTSWGTAGGKCPVPSQKKIGKNGGIDELKPQFIEAHNYFRCLHGTPDLVWDDDLEELALDAATKSALTGTLTHTYLGENLALTTIDVSKSTGFGIVKAWYDERKVYTFGEKTPEDIDPVGHLTQVLWKSSERVGCNIALDSNGNWQYACEYDPPGNVATLFAENVPDPIS
ncbi:Golgi-associated plant pathogenesis-related protein 1-like [Saccoglossus kowalevskii]|uniref:Cell wall protein PRY3-like n=1 Tax=Saccoglossus kowalevskii TaxID=10224 RepID=A0ABM0M455_SACKO|nr:PREDICTED: cell wall protein PRY3-like [Saccoglossus kowalevskii]